MIDTEMPDSPHKIDVAMSLVLAWEARGDRNLVQAGQDVQPGQLIAEVGNQGESTGPYLYFQIEAGNRAVDPVEFYEKQSAPPLCG